MPVIAAPESAVRNVGYFECAYLIFWGIFFFYLLFLTVKLRRMEKDKSK